MTRKHKKSHSNGEAAEPVAPVAAADLAPDTPAPAPEPAADSAAPLAAEVEHLKDQLLRLGADFDNFRRRAQKERAEMWPKAQAEVAAQLLDALDDLGRVAHLDPEGTSARDIAAGVELVEKKMLKQFEAAGLARVGQPGEKFDPASHEAVSTVPAAAADQDHTVAQVFQPGYRFGNVLLRPARVQVSIWEASDGGA